MLKKVKLFLLALFIEHKWRRIGRNRQRMEILLACKEPYTSLRLVRLDENTAKLGFSAKELENRYLQIKIAG